MISHRIMHSPAKKKRTLNQTIFRRVAFLFGIAGVVGIALFFIFILGLQSYVVRFFGESVSHTVTHLLEDFDQLFHTVEVIYDRKLVDIMDEFDRLYHQYIRSGGQLPLTQPFLEGIYHFLHQMVVTDSYFTDRELHYYLISPQGEVVISNLEKDVGLLLNRMPSFWNPLSQMAQGEYRLQRLAFGTRTQIPNKYAYYKLHEGWIFEISLQLDPDLVHTYFDRIATLNELPFLQNIVIYDEIHGLSFREDAFDVDPDDLAIALSLLERQDEKELTYLQGFSQKTFMLWEPIHPKKSLFIEARVVWFDLDFSIVGAFFWGIFGTVFGFFVVLGGLMLWASRRISRKIVEPVKLLELEMKGYKDEKEDYAFNEKAIGELAILEVEGLFKQFRSLAQELSASFEELKAVNDDLEASYLAVDELSDKLQQIVGLASRITVKATQKDESFLTDILNMALELIPEADSGSISIIEGDVWRFVDAVGHHIEALKKIPLKASYIFNPKEGVAHVDALLERDKTIMPEEISTQLAAASLPLKSCLLVGLKVGDEHVGNLSLDISRDSQAIFSSNSPRILEAFGGLASAFLAIRQFMIMQGVFQKEIILSMINVLELYDSYTKGHSENVADLSAQVAEKMGLAKEEVREVYWSGLVHDIGKLLIPIHILNKPGRLSHDEFDLIKLHPVWGYSVLSRSKQLRRVSTYVRHHHERWDGNGYPDGLDQERIPLISRILAVCDAYDAMTTDRSYRQALSKEDAVNQLNMAKQTQFDPTIVDILIELVL